MLFQPFAHQLNAECTHTHAAPVHPAGIAFSFTPLKRGGPPGTPGTPSFTPGKVLLANGETRMNMLSPALDSTKLFHADVEYQKIVSEWTFQKDTVDIPQVRCASLAVGLCALCCTCRAHVAAPLLVVLPGCGPPVSFACICFQGTCGIALLRGTMHVCRSECHSRAVPSCPASTHTPLCCPLTVCFCRRTLRTTTRRRSWRTAPTRCWAWTPTGCASGT
jgi:hypothetical protein